MLHTSMMSIHKHSNLIVKVSMTQSLDDRKWLVIGDTFDESTFKEPVFKTTMMHKVKVVSIFKKANIPIDVNEGDFIVIRQWRDTDTGLSYEGVPVLQQGVEYYLYLNDTHTRSPNGYPVYAITGINGGLFSLDTKGGNYRDGANTSSLSLTD